MKKESFKDRLEKCIESNGFTVTEMARLMNCSRQSIYNWLYELTEPISPYRCRLAEIERLMDQL